MNLELDTHATYNAIHVNNDYELKFSVCSFSNSSNRFVAHQLQTKQIHFLKHAIHCARNITVEHIKKAFENTCSLYIWAFSKMNL